MGALASVAYVIAYPALPLTLATIGSIAIASDYLIAWAQSKA